MCGNAQQMNSECELLAVQDLGEVSGAQVPYTARIQAIWLSQGNCLETRPGAHEMFCWNHSFDNALVRWASQSVPRPVGFTTTTV